MLLFYLRHGDPIYDPDSLTPLGRRQAEALARRLALYGLDKIYVSSSERAKQTARPTAEVLKLEPEVLDWTNEAHAWQELANIGPDGIQRWCFYQPDLRPLFVSAAMRSMGEEWHTHPALAGTDISKGILRIRRQTDEFMASLGYVHDREAGTYHSMERNTSRVALFAHHGFGMAFMSSLLDIPYPAFATHFNMGHTGMTVIRFEDEPGDCVPDVLQVSNDSHLLFDGLPTAYNNVFRF